MSLNKLSDAAAVLRHINTWTAHRLDPALRAAFDVVSEMQITRLEEAGAMPAGMAGRNLATTGVEVHRIASLLDGLDDGGAPTDRRGRLQAIQSRIDASCRACFANALASDFLAPLHGFLAPDPEATRHLEISARQLRALESEARHLGSAPIYDALLQKVAGLVRAVPPDGGLTPVDKMHLAEILVGPEEALALLG